MNTPTVAQRLSTAGNLSLGKFLALAFFCVAWGEPHRTAASDPCDRPAWAGRVLTDCEIAGDWGVEFRCGSGTVSSVPGFDGLPGLAVQLDYQLGGASDCYVQARYVFDPPKDFTDIDLLGVTLHGMAATDGMTNRIRLMVADGPYPDGVFFGCTIGNIAHLDRWLINMSFPRQLFTHQSWSAPEPIQWDKIDRFFVVVEPPSPDDGTSIQAGSIIIDLVQVTQAASWDAPAGFESVTPGLGAAEAVGCILERQCPATGLFRSWDDGAEAHLYDQALALLMLTRKKRWDEADHLAAFLLPSQGLDGMWPRTWDCDTGDPSMDPWVGDQAWMAYALHCYATARDNPDALAAAQLSGNWLAAQMDEDGIVMTYPPETPGGEPQRSTEGNFDTWLALTHLGRTDDAARIADHLLTTFWDDELHYWWRGYEDPAIALNANVWTAKGFALHPYIDRPDMALAALGFVRRTLATTSDDGAVCGLDFDGPVSVHSEGMASFVVAGGPESQQYLDILRSLQDEDGCVPGSTDDWVTDAWWLTSQPGVAPTAWLYFALTDSPFACSSWQIPTLTRAGLAVGALLLLSAGALVISRRRSARP